MNKLKLHKPITIEEINKLTDIQKRRLLVRDILLQCDLGKIHSDDYTGYVNDRGGECYVCAVGAGYVAARKLQDKQVHYGLASGCFYEVKNFGFSMEELVRIEGLFEDCAGDINTRKALNTLYPNKENRLPRLRAIWQLIWDSPECRIVPLEEINVV